MKKLLIALILITSCYANSMNDIINVGLNILTELTKEEENVIQKSLESKQSFQNSSLLVKKYINDKNCDKILNNDGFFTGCYSYDYKGIIYGYTKLSGDTVNAKNIDERPKFYDDLSIPEKYRTTYSDYTNKNMDRGHTIASDASFDYSLKSQKATYVMSNITPQHPNTNRKSYLAVEKYERVVASKLGEVEALTIIEYDKNPKRIGRSGLAVPKGYGKIYFNEKKQFQKCFYVPNDDVIYDLRDMEIDCKKIL